MEDDKTFVGFVKYFWREKGDPRRYTGWSAERCQKLMPEFLTAWMHYRAAEAMMDTVSKDDGEFDQ